MTEQFAQALIDSAVAQVNKAGFGVVADGTVHGNGIWLNSLRVRPTRDVDPAPPAAEPDAAESPLGISADIGRLKTVSRFGGDLPPQIVFSDGEEYHRTLERVASHLLAMLPAPADVKGGDS